MEAIVKRKEYEYINKLISKLNSKISKEINLIKINPKFQNFEKTSKNFEKKNSSKNENFENYFFMIFSKLGIDINLLIEEKEIYLIFLKKKFFEIKKKKEIFFENFFFLKKKNENFFPPPPLFFQ